MWVNSFVSFEVPLFFGGNKANTKMILDCDQVCYEYVAEQGKELYELVSTVSFYIYIFKNESRCLPRSE